MNAIRTSIASFCVLLVSTAVWAPPGMNTVRVGISIGPITPTPAIAGQPISVAYTVTPGVPVTGSVVGMFQNSVLQAPGGGVVPVVTVSESNPLSGTLVIPSPAAGTAAVTLSFITPENPGCSGNPRHVYLPTCKRVELGTATVDLTVIEPTVHVRIAGSTFAQISRKDSGDGMTTTGAYLCVTHNPGCGWWGNDGTDQFFAQKSLPAGATLEGVSMTQFWPIGIDSQNGSGGWTWLDSSGTYYAHQSSSDPAHPGVKWNNTCAGGFGGKNLNYAISFLVAMPKGTDLGEPVADVASTAQPSCSWGGYSQSPVSISGGAGTPAPSGWAGQVLYCNASNTVVNYYLHIRATIVTAYSGAQGSAAPMVEDNLKLTFAPAGSVGSKSGFTTAQIYQQGTWSITSAYLTPSPTSPPNVQVKNPQSAAGLPMQSQLPAGVGAPVFDFRGGNCL